MNIDAQISEGGARLNIVKLANALNMYGPSFAISDVIDKAIDRIRAGEALARANSMALEEFKLK